MANNKTLNQEEMEALKFTERFEQMRKYAKALDDVLQLSDLANAATKSWTVFSKDSLRTYLQNPYSANSQTNLRNLSRFLKTLSFPYLQFYPYPIRLSHLKNYEDLKELLITCLFIILNYFETLT